MGLHSRVDLFMASQEMFLTKCFPMLTAFEDSFLFLSYLYTILYRTCFPRELLPLGLCILLEESFLNF